MTGRPAELVDHFVYRTWDAADRLLYIGCSLNVEKRLREHKAHARWYRRMVRVTVDGPYSYSVARSIEREATRTEDPLFNGFTAKAMQRRRARHRFFDVVSSTALAAGESLQDAMNQAAIATEFEHPSCSCYTEHLEVGGFDQGCPVHDSVTA